METKEKSVALLNELIKVNNDRIAGFAHAATELGDSDYDLKINFKNFKEQSREYVHELSRAIDMMGGEPETGTTSGGDLYGLWLYIKPLFNRLNRENILEACERGEEAIKKAYNDVLTKEGYLSADLKQLVSKQRQGIISAEDKIKSLHFSAA